MINRRAMSVFDIGRPDKEDRVAKFQKNKGKTTTMQSAAQPSE